ncbi:MAG TPA: DEAD/DEAH box helicase [Anaerolineae bacterium]|nr:DEAD/DEAH box helicase [Anaerolineae bacterium]
MPLELDPIRTTDQLRQSYLRYLKTIYPLQNPALREQFWEKLEEPDRLVKGPLLEGAPPFKTARPIGQLIQDGILHKDFRLLASEALPLDRPLYAHQERAIDKSVRLGRNLVVATGTGSGKTETFLIPILDHCLHERASGTLSQPGVRALLLYPMNALANDQMKRLRRMLAGFPEITFGRYIGETEEKPMRAEERFREQFPEEPRLPNELLSREEMRARPPHILLTNYAMLEYLLLRPADSEFFDGSTAGRWRFIVLDEAHTYDGATGIEIAMLLRRLKDRVVKSERGRLRCMATSATLGGEGDFQGVTAFASNLFGETFEWQDVILAERIPLSALGAPWGEGRPELYAALWQTLQGEPESTAPLLSRLREQALSFGVPADIIEGSGQTVDRFLFDTLLGDGRLQHLREMLAEAPCFFLSAAAAIFPDQGEEAASSLAALVSLAVRARPDANSLALVPARYHLFARALEGAFVCLRNHQAAFEADTSGLDDSRMYLTRREVCPECAERGRKGQVFELAACTRCGREYLVGRIVEAGRELFDSESGLAHLKQLVVDIGEIRGEKAYFLIDVQPSDSDEDEEAALGEDVSVEPPGEPYVLCVACAAIAPQADGELHCSCSDRPGAHLRVMRVDLKGHTELHYCAACGSRSTGEVVYRFLPGQDAPVSVLATALYQQIPPSRIGLNKPGQGRKLLIFSDSRQDAAFFAAYMERTYGGLLRRRLIVKTLTEEPDAVTGMLRLKDIVSPVLQRAEQVMLFTQRQSFAERKQIIWTWLMQEFLAFDRRISPEGVGLMAFRLVKPAGWQPLAPLAEDPWNLTPDEQWVLLQILLDTLRYQGVVTFPDSVSPNGNDAFAPRARELFMRESGSDPKAGILSWMPTRGSNRRLDFLSRLLSFRAPTLKEGDRRKIALEALSGVWRHLTGPQSVWREYLSALNRGKEGIVYRIDHEFWELVPALTPEARSGQWRRCQRCGVLTHLDLSICPTYHCEGRLISLNPNEASEVENHYRRLYLGLEPIPFSIEEHTAQWTSAEAASIQEAFVKGEVNALSCSTTFELGVDVGELQAVLMRNVPPTTANYVQRAGRAGRRTDSTAFAVTFAQRRSHDLTHYANPKRIVAGKIRPPTFAIANEKIVRRHMHSVVFAMFFRSIRDQTGRQFHTVGDYFDVPEGAPSGPALLKGYLTSRPASLQEALTRVVPSELQAELGIETWEWITGLTNLDGTGVLDNAQSEVENDLTIFSQLMDEAIAQKQGYDLERYKRILVTLRSRDLLGFLGSRNVLPKYGFPVDVVELKTDHLHFDTAKKLDLQRDLRIALSEYAPGGEIVAGKRVWVSGGLYRRPDRGWPEYYYAVCSECGRFNSSPAQLNGTCKACGTALGHGHQQFVRPVFGFVADLKEPRTPGEGRPQRTYTSRVFFADYATHVDPEIETEGTFRLGSAFAVDKRYSRHGKLAVINAGPRGRGFRICASCGRGEVVPESTKVRRNAPRDHLDPRTGRKCRGTFVNRHLGHEFLTDVLELRFLGTLCVGRDEGFWLSLLYATLEGAAETLSIRRDDLDGCLYRYNLSQPPALMLFDNVPGGAGHVKRIGDNLKPVLASALERIGNCECGPETSCYECLRNYRNQPYHELLARGPVVEFLKQVVR